MEEPSEEAKYLSSDRNWRLAELWNTRVFFLTSAAAERISSSFSSIGHIERVALKGRCPAVAIGAGGRQFERARLQRGIGAGHVDGFTGDARNLVAGDDRGSRKSPGAVGDHANSEAEAGVLSDVGDFESFASAALRRHAQGDVLVVVAVDADVAVGGFELLGFAKGRIGEFFEVFRWRRRAGFRVRWRAEQFCSE